jgi:hypothetical protein
MMHAEVNLPSQSYMERAWKVYGELRKREVIHPDVYALQIVVAIAAVLEDFETDKILKELAESTIVEEGPCGAR